MTGEGARRSRAWLAGLALLLGVLLAGCALSVYLVHARALEPPAGKLDLGAFAIVSGNELRLCPGNRTVCATFYRVDLVVPGAERASGHRTLVRIPLALDP